MCDFFALLVGPRVCISPSSMTSGPSIDYSFHRADACHLPSSRIKFSPMALSFVWMVEDQSWLLFSAATSLSIVSIPLLFLYHPLRCLKLFRWVSGSDHCQGLDIPLDLGLLLESPLVRCGSLALTIPILCSNFCLSRCQFLNSSSSHQQKSLPRSMFQLRDQFYAGCDLHRFSSN